MRTLLQALSCLFRLLPLLVCLLLPSARPSHAQDWHLLTVPDAWRSVPAGDLKPIDGYSWYRALVRIPEEWNEQPLTLFIEALDDARSAWAGGQAVGLTGTFPPNFRSGLGERGRFAVEPQLVHGGAFLPIAIRVYQYDPRPNFSVAPPVLMNEARREAIRLEGIWQYRPGDDNKWAAATPADFKFDPAQPLSDADAAKLGVHRRVDMVDNVEKYVARRNGDTDPLSPAEALARFQTPSDLQVELVVADPVIAQPLFMSWDERGRLWVMEYRQYPDPAGLKMVSRDTFLRSVYDKVPQPPPRHVPGADRISIHEDRDGDGTPEIHSVFVDGLNIATSFAVGRGGVFVTNPPYLLFYPDRNHDDVPDGDPEVLLEGFGIEDSHSVINSLRFGPDGWLYGGQGSTVSAAVKAPGSTQPPVRSLGQVIWRYHPETKVYEIFAEGGGNTFGCEIDAKGRVFSGHNGGDTRGFHYVQGGYYRKGFGKHGPLSNPFSFGFFEQIRHHSVPRFTHTFVIYEDQLLPERFRGRLFGVEPLQGQVVLSDLRPWQSSFETEDIERVLKTDDPWFRPVDIRTGPDGAIYVADLYEQRIDHSSHYAGRVHKSSGRIYRLTPKTNAGSHPTAPASLGKATSQQLVAELHEPSRTRRQTALRLLGDRHDESLIPELRKELFAASGQTALELLWALHASGGLSDQAALELLQHPESDVRAWTVRLVCDPVGTRPETAAALALAADRESYIDVRKQMASSARRLPPQLALPILKALLQYDEDAADLHQPLLLWWALEAQIGRTPAETILQAVFDSPQQWQRPLVSQHLAERFMKRYALAGTRADLVEAARVLKAAPDRQTADRLLKGFEEAFQGRSLAGIPDELVEALAASGGGSLALRFRQAQPDAVTEALQLVVDRSTPASTRIPLIEICGQLRQPMLLETLLKLSAEENDSTLLAAVLTALQNYDSPEIAHSVLSRLPKLDGDAALAAESLLASRAGWTEQLLVAIEAGQVQATQLSAAAVRRMQLHDSPAIRASLERLSLAVAGLSASQVQAETSAVMTALATGSGNPRTGKRLFMQNCGRCHLLFEEGGRIGPDLTPFNRDNLERMLASVINPGIEIREGFENHLLVTTDGRILNGFLVERDGQVVILKGVDGQNVIVKQDDIEELKVVPQSVMPEGTLKGLNEQQLRDLFAYLRSTQPVNY
ncbi:MAG: PVC-type heme-binding CxxCH protein [Planctomycetaceae bacterium]